jgi:hypothetical protein
MLMLFGPQGCHSRRRTKIRNHFWWEFRSIGLERFNFLLLGSLVETRLLVLVNLDSFLCQQTCKQIGVDKSPSIQVA